MAEQRSDAEKARDPFLGSVIDDKYELLELLGGGGTGVVYRARHCNLDSQVAVKMLFPHMASRQHAVRRFQQEATATSALNHPNIVRVLDFGTAQEGQPYLVMEYIQGSTLADYLAREGPLAPALAAEIIIQASHGLSHAHSKGVVHRDIKPSNLMIVGNAPHNFTVKIVDFGLARPSKRDEQQSKVTITGEVFGSPAYMSPEQCRGQSVDHRADLYSIGCVFFEALSGKPPFTGVDPIDTIFKHVSEAPPVVQLEESSPAIAAHAQRIVEKSLAKDKENRYQSSAELVEDLAHFKEVVDTLNENL